MRLRALIPRLVCLAVGLAPLLAQAQPAANWRIFREPDGLADAFSTAVSSSPRGNVWLKHGDRPNITVFDGYSIHSLPSPGKGNFRIYESLTGQLWTLYPEGLLLYDRNAGWVRHPIPEIRAEIQSDLLRQIRQIPLLPAEHDRVLFLLSDQLMEYHARRKQTAILRTSGETRLGKFLEMTEARDGGIWISGTQGLGKLAGPSRRWDASSTWTPILSADTLEVENLQRPFENDRGHLALAASDTTADTRRVLLHFDGQSWRKHRVGTELIRQAWPSWDNTLWAYAINSLLRFTLTPDGELQKERVLVAQCHDVAVEPNGLFWLATSDGLARFSPFPWRPPQSLQRVDSLVHAIVQDAQQRFWIATSDGLILRENSATSLIPWPEHFEPDFQSTDALYTLPNHTLVITHQSRPLAFDPATRRFQIIQHPAGRTLRFLGRLNDGALCAQTIPNPSQTQPQPTNALQLEIFHGTHFQPWLQLIPAADLGELHSVLHLPNGDLWLAGTQGLARWQTFTNSTTQTDKVFLEEKIFALLHAGDERIWCGSTDGILEFNGKSWTTLLPGVDRINKFLKTDDGKIWAASSHGLYCFHQGSWLWHGFDEGLPSTTIADLFQDQASRLWAGTTRGIRMHHPEADTSPPKTMEPVLATAGKLMTEDPVTIIFQGVDKWQQTPSERLLFSYRLDEGPWSPFTNALSQTFASIPAGKHRVEVRAMDRTWNQDPASAFLEFAIVIPWTQEPRVLAILLIGVILVLFFAGLAVNRHLQLTRSYAEVEKIVALRTRELERANQQLLHTEKMRALGTMAAGIAHDFNNILSIVKGSAQIIESNLDNKTKILTRLERIKAVVDQGAGIVRSMLGLSRITEQDFKEYHLNEFIEQTGELLGDRFLEEVTLHLELAPSLPQVRAVREWLQQILLNLILNAADAMSGVGEVSVKTGLARELPPDLALSPAPASSYVYASVRDTGSGISPQVLPRIFEPFFTTKSLSTRRGTGLGLSMVYQLAKEMGFGLRVQSQVGQGSTFTIWIPVATQDPVTPPDSLPMGSHLNV